MIKNIVIPMAGLGTRFKKNNFSTIKPLIKIDNKSILEESIKSLPPARSKYCVLQKNIYDRYELIKKILRKNKISPFVLAEDTLGQSDTCNKVIDLVSKEEDLFIHSCDYIMKFSKKKFSKLCKNSDVLIFTYRLKSTIVKDYKDYAYCRIKNGLVNKITEKTLISKKPHDDHMVVGTFWFKKSYDFFEMHKKAMMNRNFVNNELYVANNINYLIKKKKKVKVFEVEYWKNLGDVFSYNQFIYWKNYFENNNL